MSLEAPDLLQQLEIFVRDQLPGLTLSRADKSYRWTKCGSHERFVDIAAVGDGFCHVEMTGFPDLELESREALLPLLCLLLRSLDHGSVELLGWRRRMLASFALRISVDGEEGFLPQAPAPGVTVRNSSSLWTTAPTS